MLHHLRKIKERMKTGIALRRISLTSTGDPGCENPLNAEAVTVTVIMKRASNSAVINAKAKNAINSRKLIYSLERS